jgi:hypothetical protein
VHADVVEVPRAPGVIAVSRALVAVAVVPPHSVSAPAHITSAAASEVETGPDTATTPVAWSVEPASAMRFSTVVWVSVVHFPLTPRLVQDEVALLSRTPVTSPLAPPEVPDAVVPAHSASAHSMLDPAELPAVSSAAAGSVPPAIVRRSC